MAVELTNYCNFSCSYCPHAIRNQGAVENVNPFDRRQGFMSDETFALALENAAKYARSVSISFFGEQMLHRRFNELIRSVPRDRKYHLVTNTNGSLLTHKNIETLKLFDIVRFSIDSVDSESFERLRPGSAVLTINGKRGENRFDTLAEKIEHWLNLPDHPPTFLVHVTTDANQHDRQAYLDHWLPRMGPNDHVIMKSVISYGGVMKDPYMTENPCTIPEDKRVVIAWNGDCTPCNLDVNVALKYGNIHVTPDLRRMIRSAKYKRVISGIRRNQGICANCDDANNHVESVSYQGLRDTESTTPVRVLSREEVIEYGHRRAA